MALLQDFRFRLPAWVAACLPAQPLPPQAEPRMHFVLDLVRRQLTQGSGGPFAAAVFAADGSLLSVGLNLVEPAQCSLLHAELVAIALAQQQLGRYDLAGCELVCSTEPCAMCLGAVPWSGVARLVCAARDADARAVGFDEGDKPPDWEQALAARGIAVRRDVLRAEAAALLQDYARRGGLIYNG